MGVLKLTDWFPGDVKPVRVGVYQTNSHRFQYWNGQWWGFFMPNPEAALKFRSSKSASQARRWRGLASPPEEK